MPTRTNSNLSDPHYGYDVVVSTTAASLNRAMRAYLAAGDQPTIELCFCADDKGAPVQVDGAKLRAQTGVDPFSVANEADIDSPEVKALAAARFLVGFRASIGMPAGVDPERVEVVHLESDASQVTYRLYCSAFTVVEYVNSGYSTRWVNVSQPSGAPWVLEAKIDLRLTAMADTAYATLPADVQAEIKNLGPDRCSVQQLLFDLTNAKLASTFPNIPGLDPSSLGADALRRYFLGTYFTAQQSKSQPMLGCVVRPSQPDPSPLAPTDLTLMTQVNPQQAGLSTLNYLMMTAGRPLPPAVPFAWDWVGPGEAGVDGTIAIRRAVFAAQLRDQIAAQARSHCLVPKVRVWLDGGPLSWMKVDTTCRYSASLNPLDTPPQVTIPAKGPLLQIEYDSGEVHDSAGVGDSIGAMAVRCGFNLGITAAGNTVQIAQQATVHLYVRSLQSSKSGNVVDLTRIDTFTASVSPDGTLTLTPSGAPVIQDRSTRLSTDGFTDLFTDLNGILDTFASGFRDTSVMSFTAVQVSAARTFVFPGARTFNFANPVFSDAMDLVATITYDPPTSAHDVPDDLPIVYPHGLSDGPNDGSQSNLSDAHYGYDLVVATTQDSVNATMRAYLSTLSQPEFTQCYVASTDGNPTPIALADLLKLTDNVNPFEIEATADPKNNSDTRFASLHKARFMVGFMARIGLPAVADPSTLPDIVVLGSQASAVTFRLMCSSFQIVQYSPGGYDGDSWLNKSQAAEQPWLFVSKVDLRLSKVDQTAYSTLPPAVQTQIKNLGSQIFSVEQLLFDLGNAKLAAQQPVIDGADVSSDIVQVLNKYFLGTYFKAMQRDGQPLLGCVVRPDSTPDPATVKPRDLNFSVSPMVDAAGQQLANPTQAQAGLSTLGYLMLTTPGQDPPPANLPPAVPFQWNWVSPEQANDFHGAIAYNRLAFAACLKPQVLQYAVPNCLHFDASCSASGYEITTYAGDKQPTVTLPTTGNVLLNLNWASEEARDEYGTPGVVYGRLRVKSTFDLKIEVSGSTMTVTQHLVVHLFVMALSAESSGNVLDRTLTDTYTLAVDGSGQLRFSTPDPKATPATSVTDNADYQDKSNPFSNFFTGVNDREKYFGEWLKRIAPSAFKTMDLNQLRSFVFPGGRTFAFKDGSFSANGDLIAHLTYLDPTADPPAAHGLPEAPQTTTTPSQGLSITSSSEILRQFLPAELISPQQRFEAVQTADGNTLLLSIGTDNRLHAMVERPGGGSGWTRHDLTDALLTALGPASTVKSFAVQQRSDRSIDVVAVITAGGDHLYTCLGNSSAALGWLDAPTWTEHKYDDTDHPRDPNTIKVKDVFLLANQGMSLFVADVDDGSGFAFRYIIDPKKKYLLGPPDQRKTDRVWNAADLASNFDVITGSALGARAQSQYKVPATYTLGSLQTRPVLLCTPLYNLFGNGPPSPVRLTAPAKASALAVSAASDADSPDSDLWVAGSDGIHYFSPAAQVNDGSGTLICRGALVQDIDQLRAWSDGKKVVLWGRNTRQQIFYLTAPRASAADPAEWSVPLPLATGVEQLSAYVNRVDDGRTFFADLGEGRLQKAMQAPGTLLWNFQDILLPALGDAVHDYDAHTTRVQIADTQKQGVPGQKLQLSASERTPVYIGGHYYVLTPRPLDLVTDASGGLTIAQAAKNLSPALLTVKLPDGTTAEIDAASGHVEKLSKLATPDALGAARIASSVGGTPDRSLVPPDAPSDARQAAADMLGNLKIARDGLAASGTASAHTMPPAAAVAHAEVIQLRRSGGRLSGCSGPQAQQQAAPGRTLAPAAHDLGGALGAFAGDVVEAFKSVLRGANDFGLTLKKEADQVWRMIVQIGEQALTFALDCAQKVAAAMEMVFHALKTAWNDLVDFLKFLFEWDDFRRTRDAFTHLFHVYYQGFVADIQGVKTTIHAKLQAAKDVLDSWAKIAPDTWNPQFTTDQPATQPTRDNDPLSFLTSPARYLLDQVVPHLIQIRFKDNPTADPKSGGLLTALIDAVNNEAAVVKDAVKRIQKELVEGDRWKSMPLLELLKKVLAILLDGVMNTAAVLVDGILDMVVAVLEQLLAILEAEISFPLLNSVLKYFNVTPVSISFMDVFGLIIAIPATLVCKGIIGRAPFSDNQLTALKHADTREKVEALLRPPSTSAHGIPEIPGDYATPVFIVCKLVSGLATVLGSIPETTEANSEAGEGAGQWELFSGVATAIAGVTGFIASRSPERLPLKQEALATLETVMGTVKTVADVGLAVGPLIFAKGDQKVADTCAFTAMIIDVVLGVHLLAPAAYHFYELSQVPASTDRSIVIIDRTADILSFLSDCTQLAATIDEEPISKAVLVASTGVLHLGAGLLAISEVVVLAAAPPHAG